MPKYIVRVYAKTIAVQEEVEDTSAENAADTVLEYATVNLEDGECLDSVVVMDESGEIIREEDL